MKQEALFEGEVGYRKHLLPIREKLEAKPVPTWIWDIPYTIGQLAYLTHNHFRYYGKFPSVVAAQLLDDYPPPSKQHYVLDNFCGSGTSLVEAKLRGIDSYGIDISWIAALASNVKTSFVDLKKISILLDESIEHLANTSSTDIGDEFTSKWFSQKTTRELDSLGRFIKSRKRSPERDFLLVGYLAIIRRVSRAFDGEVRPHINKEKKRRDVAKAFTKKIRDMMLRHEQFMEEAQRDCIAECYVGSNLDLEGLMPSRKCYLVISHPPYLNSFDYSPVYNMEYYWGDRFKADYSGMSRGEVADRELKAYPANEATTLNYYKHLRACYEQTYNLQQEGGLLAIVIGDCTIKGEVEPVIDKTIDLAKDIGYKLKQINYRTTHYGLGKYAYNFRADYHGKAKKKDGILIFKK